MMEIMMKSQPNYIKVIVVDVLIVRVVDVSGAGLRLYNLTHLPDCLSACLPFCLVACLPNCPPACLTACLPVNLPL